MGLGLGIGFRDFLGISIYRIYIYIFPMNTDMSCQTKTVFFFPFFGDLMANSWKYTLFCCFSSSPKYKTFPSTCPEMVGFQGLGHHFRGIPVSRPPTNLQPFIQSQLRTEKRKLQETYASKLKQMKAMHSELQTYQSQVGCRGSETVLETCWETWVLRGFGGTQRMSLWEGEKYIG